jgi:hypothetical protein
VCLELKTSRFQGHWVQHSGGPLSLKQARAFVRSRGVVIPKYLTLYLPEEYGLTLSESGLADADAIYYRIDQTPENADILVYWEQLLTARKQLPVALRKEVLRSDEHCLYVFSHEIFEITRLKKVFSESGGAFTFRRLGFLIDPGLNGAIHEDAVRHGDALVEELRKERGM